MELVYRLYLAFLLPLPCIGVDWDLSQQFIFVAGPLTNDLVNNLNSQSGHGRESAFPAEMAQSDFICHQPSFSSLLPYFAELHASGVTHFKVFLPWTHLLPEMNTRNPNKTNVECYRQLLGTLRAVQLKPILVLNQRITSKSSNSQLSLTESTTFIDLFVEYAKFSFESFGDLVDTWLTFSHLPEVTEGLHHGDALDYPLQVFATAHEKAYTMYHENYFSEDGKVSISLDIHDAVTGPPGSFLTSILVIDFITLGLFLN